MQAVQRIQLIKKNFNPYISLVTGDKADNQIFFYTFIEDSFFLGNKVNFVLKAKNAF